MARMLSSLYNYYKHYSGAWRRWNISTVIQWPVFGWALLYLLLTGSLQLYSSYPFDADTAYHAVVGRLIREHGILHSFPWTPFSWLADHYADKELLFHLLFVPLAGISWITASKIVGAVAGAVVLMSLYLVLRAERVQLAGLWALVPLAVSGVFVFRLALVRPHLLSIALALVVLWAAARGRLVILAVTSFIYPWAYVAWQLPIFFVLIAGLSRVLCGERLWWKPAATTLAALALGVVLHPNGINLVRLSWIQLVDVLLQNAWGSKAGFELGRELQSFTVVQWAQWLMGGTLMAFAGLVLAWRRRRDNETALAFALAALVFGALTVKSMRFAEYFVPFSVASLALSARSVPWRLFPQVVLGVSVLYTVAVGSGTVVALSMRGDDLPPAIAEALQRQIPAGSQVFTCEWGLTGTLMAALPDRRFIVALDPTFFYVKDPELYQLWRQICREAPPDMAGNIRRRFGARHALSLGSKQSAAFVAPLIAEPGVRPILVSDSWILFDLGGPSP